MKDEFVVAICGNPNSGKTSVFNALTGSHQTVGNWPGVTVERKEGFFRVGGRKYTVVDLPGTYSLTANSLDERIARDFLLNGEPDVIVVVVDKTNMERNLYLVLELMEMEKNMVIDMNMADEAEKKGIKVDTVNMSKFINLPIVDTVATTKEGIDDLKKVIYELSSNPTKPRRLKYEDRFEKYVVKVENLLKDSSRMLNYPLRWIAIKLLEKDEYVSKLVDDETMMRVQKIIEELERNYGESSEIVTAEARYALIHGISKEFVKIIPTIGKRFNLTDRLDMIFTNRIIGLPIFFLIMWAVFQITYWFGGMFSDLIDEGFNQLRIFFSNVLSGAPVFLRSFIVDGVIGGVGSILVFLPNIFFLFLAISFLGDLGYMARAAFVMDRIMHLMGLHGKAFIPMLLGFGCNVPAVMATRTLESEKDRIMTALIIPLMSCSARLPIYVIFAGTFFK
ncbi:MAG: ferrous iron transport protein B, partial [Thermotoga sp.]